MLHGWRMQIKKTKRKKKKKKPEEEVEKEEKEKEKQKRRDKQPKAEVRNQSVKPMPPLTKPNPEYKTISNDTRLTTVNPLPFQNKQKKKTQYSNKNALFPPKQKYRIIRECV